MSNDLLNCSDPIIVKRNAVVPLLYTPLFGMFPESRVTQFGMCTTKVTSSTSRANNDFKFNFKGNHQPEVYNRKASTETSTFTPAVFENEYRESTGCTPSAQLAMDADNIKKFSILADRCLMIGDLALPFDVDTEQAVTDFGNKGFLNAPGNVTAPSTLIDTPQALLNALNNISEALSSGIESQPSQVFFIIPYLLRPLWFSIMTGTNTLAGPLLDGILNGMYGGVVFAETQAYAIPADAGNIIGFIPEYLDLNMTTVPQIYKTEDKVYDDEFKTKYISGTLGLHIRQHGSVVIQPFTQA